MRQIQRQPSFSYFLIFLALCLIMFKLRNWNSDITIEECGPVSVVGTDLVAISMKQAMSGGPLFTTQDDPRILNYIWTTKLIEPASEEPYNLKEPTIDPSRGQGQMIRKILQNMTSGFFVECGALDGETRSNTLFLEQHLGWTGLLVEGDPSNYKKMKLKNRKSWISNTCLAVKPYPHKANFLQSFNVGKILNETQFPNLKNRKDVVEVQCMPLFSLLTALNISTLDYFSLDVEGSELQVLKTIPFDKLLIKTLSVEFFHTGEGKQKLLEFMVSKGYRLYDEVHYPNNLANDLILVHESLEDVKFLD